MEDGFRIRNTSELRDELQAGNGCVLLEHFDALGLSREDRLQTLRNIAMLDRKISGSAELPSLEVEFSGHADWYRDTPDEVSINRVFEIMLWQPIVGNSRTGQSLYADALPTDMNGTVRGCRNRDGSDSGLQRRSS